MPKTSHAVKDGLMTEQMRFLRRLAADPRSIGALAPSGPALASAMVDQIDLEQGGPVIELGPGPGSITRELIARGVTMLTVIERDPAFAQLIRMRFENVNVIEGDALNLRQTLTGWQSHSCTAIVSGLPLLNFSQDARAGLISDAMMVLRPGAPFIQFSYGLHKPVSAPAGVVVTMAGLVWKNFPPARVWVYRQS